MSRNDSSFQDCNGFDNVDKNTWFKFVGERETVTRLNQDSINLAKPVARLEIRKNIFSHRVIDLWNTLPHDVNMQKIPYNLNKCMIRIIENVVAAYLRKTSDL